MRQEEVYFDSVSRKRGPFPPLPHFLLSLFSRDVEMFSFRISSRREKEKEGLKAETFLVLLRAGRAMNALMMKERERKMKSQRGGRKGKYVGRN